MKTSLPLAILTASAMLSGTAAIAATKVQTHTKVVTHTKTVKKGRTVTAKLANGKTVTYDCSLAGNKTKTACK